MQRVDGNSLPMFRDTISIQSSRVKNLRTAQFLGPRIQEKRSSYLFRGGSQKSWYLVRQARRTKKQTVGSFVDKSGAALPEPYLHTSCSETLYHNTIFFIYACDSHNLQFTTPFIYMICKILGTCQLVTCFIQNHFAPIL
jgi:hypothetical protein